MRTLIRAFVLGGLSLSPFGARDVNAQNKALLLFGGDDHKTFLGCLNCAAPSPLSICNEYGEFGSRYRANSIWNAYGTFGSAYNQHSPWNKYSQGGPVIVDREGNSYGYFTENKYRAGRTRIDWLVSLLDYQDDKDDLDKTRDLLCSN